MHAARDCAQQLLLPAPVGVRRGTPSSEAARPDFHRPSGLRQPATAGGALAGGSSGRPSAHPAATWSTIIDWATRRVLSWRLSNTLTAGFCVEALGDALARFGKPDIFNTDQGSQLTSDEFTQMLRDHGVEISMDGRGRCHDNIFVERLWWTVKHEWVYLRP